MKRRIVFKGINVTKDADRIIERICVTCNYHELRINGDDKVSVSALMGHVFEEIAASNNKPQKLKDFLSIVSLKDSRGEQVRSEALDKIIEDVLRQ